MKTITIVGVWFLFVFAAWEIVRNHPDYPSGYEGYLARNAQERVVVFTALALLLVTLFVICLLVRLPREKEPCQVDTVSTKVGAPPLQ